jgi:cleavage and polyadenylation specificity factor subunit 3
MASELIFLGGVTDIGANSVYYYSDGTGVILDAGLHPVKKDREAFPFFELIKDHPTDLLLISHAHTDHSGAIPYALKLFPHLRIISTEASRELLSIMLKDTARILKTDIKYEFGEELLSLYSPEMLEKIGLITEGIKFDEAFSFTGRRGLNPLDIKLAPAGHILGAGSIVIESSGKSLLYTGDINFSDQWVIPSARLPKIHFDVAIIESTNAGFNQPDTYQNQIKRISAFINEIVDKNGSVLIPVFALGKSQEMLKLIWNLMKKGSIPKIPIYTAGLMRRISRIYDKYCYSVPMVKPGFEISDIPQITIRRDSINTGDYFKEPSIVIIPSGMMNEGTWSYKLAHQWFRRKNFGIAIVGYQDENSPGSALLSSVIGKDFLFGSKKVIRSCEIGSFRFTSHTRMEDIMNYLSLVKPIKIFVIHGDEESTSNLALNLIDSLPASEVIIPRIGKAYQI